MSKKEYCVMKRNGREEKSNTRPCTIYRAHTEHISSCHSWEIGWLEEGPTHKYTFFLGKKSGEIFDRILSGCFLFLFAVPKYAYFSTIILTGLPWAWAYTRAHSHYSLFDNGPIYFLVFHIYIFRQNIDHVWTRGTIACCTCESVFVSKPKWPFFSMWYSSALPGPKAKGRSSKVEGRGI